MTQAGQEDRPKGLIAAAQQAKDEIKQKEAQADEVRNRLESKKKFRESYKETLAQSLAELLRVLDWVRGWTADVVVTDGRGISIKGHSFATKDGILLVVATPDGRVMHQGMLVTQEPVLDYAGIYTLALQAENTMDKERGLLLDSPSPDDKMATGGVIIDAHGRTIDSNKAGTSGTDPAPV